ncbi:MBL fold metallo-hydrolase [Pseudothioclava arenosa]|uniref:MBL fold metallo-hydrolase n=1 Tax=Pseudothioclava arenosa TaxID=1795308 RepID=A0A2A4CRU7_9RHOB|nr:MBL fold metallo-hydrolase [Pseudothioclava arenosa]PCD76856.1 MBL fold metallo-hydrolase [Pseudothioclava arenosa]
MNLTRRTILRGAMGGALTLGASSLLPRRSFAASTLALGSAMLDTLSDGNLVLPLSFVTPHDGAAAKLAELGVTGDQVEPPCNVTLYRDGTNTVLFDVGAGPDFMPTAGKLGEALDALGVSAEEVTHVIFTHAHPDHLWGVLDDFDEPLFTNATHMMGAAEMDYWLNPETVNTIGTERQSFAAGALRRLEILKDQIETFEPEAELLPGIRAHASFGHTPGHMAFEVAQGSNSVMIVGDAIGNGHLAFAVPDWVSGSDQDAEMGVATRLSLLSMLAERKMAMIGYHLPGGGIGMVEAANGAYRFEPEV